MGADTAYASHVLPGLVVLGPDLGLVFAVRFEAGIMGVASNHAGVASAMVNPTQQVGGSIGTALLSTLAATAAASFPIGRPDTSETTTQASVSGYITTFWWSAAIFAASAIARGLLLRNGLPEPHAEADAEPDARAAPALAA